MSGPKGFPPPFNPKDPEQRKRVGFDSIMDEKDLRAERRSFRVLRDI